MPLLFRVVASPRRYARRALQLLRDEFESGGSTANKARERRLRFDLWGGAEDAALARAVIMGPDVILADEPTGNLDWEMSLRLLTLLVELNKMGKTILVATHDLNLIRTAKNQVAARVLRIRNRRIQLAGADL